MSEQTETAPHNCPECGSIHYRHTSRHIGVSATTPTFIRKTGEIFEARCGIAILGQANLSSAELETADPFDDDFRDNFASGTGPTEADALADLADCCRKMADSLWI